MQLQVGALTMLQLVWSYLFHMHRASASLLEITIGNFILSVCKHPAKLILLNIDSECMS